MHGIYACMEPLELPSCRYVCHTWNMSVWAGIHGFQMSPVTGSLPFPKRERFAAEYHPQVKAPAGESLI